MANYITGFKTSEGVKQYDYNALANLPADVTDATNTVISPNADYAEVGEWADGNPTAEDRLGYFVAIAEVGDNTIKIRKATSTDDVRGVSVYNPAFSGNASRDKYGEDGELLAQYNYIGVMGIVKVIDNGLCSVNGRCMPGDDGTAIPSTNNMGYAVLERVDDTHVLIAVEPGADMIQRVKTDIEIIDAAPPIVLSAEGEGVTITGSAKYRLQGFNVLGKTTQNGTPAPNAPIPLESVGDDGVVVTEITGANLCDLDNATFTNCTRSGDKLISNIKESYFAAVRFTNMSQYLLSMRGKSLTFSIKDNFNKNIAIIIYGERTSGATYQEATRKSRTISMVIASDFTDITALEFRWNRSTTAFTDTTTVCEEIMLNSGSTALPYEPYTKQQITTSTPNGLCGVQVSSGGNYTDENGQQWICDEIDFERGVLIKRTHTITFVGAEDFINLGLAGDANAFFYQVDLSVKPLVIDNEGFSLCSHFEQKRIASSTTAVGHQIRKVSTSEQYRIVFRPEGIANMAGATFMSWLKENPTTVVYALATPTETPLSAEDIEAFKSVHTNYPTTVITSDNDAYMSVKYVADTKTYIDNKLSELVASIKEG